MDDREREALAHHPVFEGGGNRSYALCYVGVDARKSPAVLTWAAVNESGDHRCGSMEMAGNGKLLSS